MTRLTTVTRATIPPAEQFRVEIPAYADLWMLGARFGVVIASHPHKVSAREIWTVKLDHPQVTKWHRFIADDCRVL